MKYIKFILRISLVSLLLLACSNELTETDEIEINNFEESLLLSKNTFSNVKTYNKIKNSKFSAKSSGNFADLNLIKNYPERNYEINNFGDVADLINIDELEYSEDKLNCDNTNTICLEVDENQIKQSLTSTVSASKQLLHDYGFTDAEMNSELGDNVETGTIIVALLIKQMERNENQGNYSLKGDPLDCMAVAIGVKGVYDLIRNTKTLATFGEAATRKQVLRLVRKLGSRFLGWMGVALLIRDFGDCMDYW